jgi:hypothetical protein
MGRLPRVPVLTGASAESLSSALSGRSVRNLRAAPRDSVDQRSFSARGSIAL